MVGFDNVFIIGIVDSIVEVFVCGCLIYGVDEGKPFWMKPWLILRGIAIFFLTIDAFTAFVTVACVSVGQGFLLLLFLIPIVTMEYLCWLVVQNVYLDTKEGKINDTNTIESMTNTLLCALFWPTIIFLMSMLNQFITVIRLFKI